MRTLFAAISALLLASQLAEAQHGAHYYLVCSNWRKMQDGTFWHVCIDAFGQEHCFVINNTPGALPREIPCI